MAGVACQQLQAAYSAIQNFIQHEWYYVHFVTPALGEAFEMSEKSPWRDNLMELFKWSDVSIQEQEATRLTV